MRVFYVITCLVVLATFTSCSSDDDNLETTEERFMIEANSELVVNIGNFSVEGGRSINRQAQDFKVSELRRGNPELGQTAQVYIYEPNEDFRGTVTVHFLIRSSSGDTNFEEAIIRYVISVR